MCDSLHHVSIYKMIQKWIIITRMGMHMVLFIWALVLLLLRGSDSVAGHRWSRLREPGHLYQTQGSTAALQQRPARPQGRWYRMTCTGWTLTTPGKVVSAINCLNSQRRLIEEVKDNDSFWNLVIYGLFWSLLNGK